jgi:hypothetical protein
MEQRRKRIAITALIIAVLTLTGAGLFSLYREKAPVDKPDQSLDIKNTAPEEKKEKPPVASKSRKFTTNEEIRIEYGKLEVVYLYNGKKYEGAVISTDEFYTMVTINGTVKIPMTEVKIREIVR